MENTGAFRNKTALATGASGGIGKAICRMLGSLGMEIFLVGRNEEKLKETAELVSKAGGSGLVCAGDLTSPEFRDALFDKVQEERGALDVLVNCAGLAHNDPFESVTPKLYDAIMDTNVRAPFFLTQKMLPLLKRSDCATVLNIASVLACKGYPFQSVYAASKHALAGWSKSLANEVFRDNIRVHLISPGGVYTDMVRVSRPDLKPEGMTLPEDIAAVAGFYLEMRNRDAVIDEIRVHRPAKEPFA